MQLTPEEKNAILTFMRNHPMTVLSTYDQKNRQPESALIAFAETDDLEIVFETFDIARKYVNLRSHPKVALVMGWNTADYRTLQYEGEAHEVTGEEVQACKELMLKKNTPCTEEFLRDPRVKFFKVTPTWIRLSDYTGDCPVIVEGTV